MVRGTGSATVFLRYLPTFRSLGAGVKTRVKRHFKVRSVRIASRMFRSTRSGMFSRTRGEVRAVGTMVITALNRFWKCTVCLVGLEGRRGFNVVGRLGVEPTSIRGGGRRGISIVPRVKRAPFFYVGI